MKHHKVAQLVNDLRDTAVKYQGCQSLREGLRATLGKYIDITIDNDSELINGMLTKENKTLELGILSVNEYLETDYIDNITLDEQDIILHDFYIAKSMIISKDKQKK